ncbi:MAG TPA: rRNA maturation RNase YbeY [Isosphaeraceae bacterium]|nr:rRNA maturation RNase YbeY [Isosphaeraceae bacterium]
MEPDPGSCPSIVVEVSDRQGHLSIDPEALAGLTRRVLEAEGVHEASISLAIVDNATIHALNRKHLGHDWPTDVITFGLSDPEDDGPLSAEIVLSAEMADETAKEAGVAPLDELALYLVHGLLHLCGQNDLDETSAAVMRRKEAEHLDREGIMNTFSKVGPSEMETEPAADGRERGGAR